jgi:hypothetical protein
MYKYTAANVSIEACYTKNFPIIITRQKVVMHWVFKSIPALDKLEITSVAYIIPSSSRNNVFGRLLPYFSASKLSVSRSNSATNSV